MRFWKFISLFRMLFGPVHKLQAERIEAMGLLAVKIAQMYAVRVDILGEEKALTLQRFYENAKAMSWPEFDRAWRREASPELLAQIATVCQEPLAVASLGQVHRAQLRDGREVILKVLKEEPLKEFRRDIQTVRWLARCALMCYPPLRRLADPLGTIEVIRRQTETELDLRNEARGSAKLAALRDSEMTRLPYLKALHFPQIYEQYTTSRLLVAEYVSAPTLRRLFTLKRFGYDELLLLFRIHGFYLFFKGQFHGDFHPGNICYQDGQFWFLDNANVEVVPRQLAHGLLTFMVHLGNSNFKAACEEIIKLGIKPMREPERFRQHFHEMYAEFGGQPIGEQSLTKQMMRTVRSAVECGLEFSEGAFPMIKSLMYLDGMALAVAPEKVLLDDVTRFRTDFGLA